MTRSPWPGGQPRISRRHAIGGALALAAGALLAGTGCGDSGGDDGDERRGGTLRIGTPLQFSFGLDPHVEQGAGLIIFPKFYGYPLHVDSRDDSVIFDHVASVEQPDAQTYILRLRDDVHFHDIAPTDGRPVEAADIVDSIERFRDNPLVTYKTWHATILDVAWAPDPQTVVIRTKRPYVYSLAELGGINAGAIVPSELAGANLTQGTAASGPFVFDTQLDRRVRLRRNDGYFLEPPFVGAMEFQLFPSEEEQLSAFESFYVDVIPNRDRNDAEMLAERLTDVVTLSERSLSYLSLGLRTDRPPFADERAREAADLSIDREELLRDLAGGDGDLLGPINPHLGDGFWALPRFEVLSAQGGDSAIDERRADARALAEAAGAAAVSFPLHVADLPQLIDVAEAVAAQLREGGLAPRVEAVPLVEWFLRFRQGDFTATLISHAPYETPDRAMRYYHTGGPTGTGNPFAYADAETDALIERAWAEGDRETRRDTLFEAQRRAIVARPMLQLFTSTGYASARSYVRNLPEGLPGSLPRYRYDAWLDETPSGRPL